MSSMTVSWIMFACVFGGTIFGLLLRDILPAHHLSTESRDVVKLGMGLTGSTAALVLGLLVASAKSSYDTQKDEVTQLSSKIILLDRAMALYGPETRGAREVLRNAVAGMMDRIWPKDGATPPQLDPSAAGAEMIYARLHELSPNNETQRSLKSEALEGPVHL